MRIEPCAAESFILWRLGRGGIVGVEPGTRIRAPESPPREKRPFGDAFFLVSLLDVGPQVAAQVEERLFLRQRKGAKIDRAGCDLPASGSHQTEVDSEILGIGGNDEVE